MRQALREAKSVGHPPGPEEKWNSSPAEGREPRSQRGFHCPIPQRVALGSRWCSLELLALERLTRPRRGAHSPHDWRQGASRVSGASVRKKTPEAGRANGTEERPREASGLVYAGRFWKITALGLGGFRWG